MVPRNSECILFRETEGIAMKKQSFSSLPSSAECFFDRKMSTPDRQERIGKGVFRASQVSSKVFHKASTHAIPLDTTIHNVVVGIQVSVLNFIAVFFLLREGVLIHPVVCYLA
jgi:hypothetical protein